MSFGVNFHLEVEVSEHRVQNILFLKMLSKFALILSSVKKEGRQISLGFLVLVLFLVLFCFFGGKHIVQQSGEIVHIIRYSKWVGKNRLLKVLCSAYVHF